MDLKFLEVLKIYLIINKHSLYIDKDFFYVCNQIKIRFITQKDLYIFLNDKCVAKIHDEEGAFQATYLDPIIQENSKVLMEQFILENQELSKDA